MIKMIREIFIKKQCTVRRQITINNVGPQTILKFPGEMFRLRDDF